MSDHEPAVVSEDGLTVTFGGRFRAKHYKGRRSFSTTTAAEQGWPVFVSTSDMDRLRPQKCLGCFEAVYKYYQAAHHTRVPLSMFRCVHRASTEKEHSERRKYWGNVIMASAPVASAPAPSRKRKFKRLRKNA